MATSAPSGGRAPRAARAPRNPRKIREKRVDAEGVRPRRAPRGSPEHQLQVLVARYLNLALPERHPDAWWTSIDHANARSSATGGIRKARGVKPGIPDVHVIHRGRSIWIELKAPQGSVSAEQREVAAKITAAGGYWHEARSVEAVQAILRFHGVKLMAQV